MVLFDPFHFELLPRQAWHITLRRLPTQQTRHPCCPCGLPRYGCNPRFRAKGERRVPSQGVTAW
jgi:hypothetical protein